MDRLGRMMDQGRSFSSHEKDCCFLNTGGERFATISACSGFEFPNDGRALALVDWDQDGYVDAWMSNRDGPRLRFLRNQLPHTHHYLALKLQGNGTTTNRDAVGARVEVVAAGLNGKRLIKSVRAGEGFLAQSSLWLTFGLGKLDKVEKVKVRWPGGAEEEFTGVAIDQRFLLVQGDGKAQAAPAPARQVSLKAAEQEPLPYKGISVPLTAHLPLPRGMTYTDFAGAKQPLPIGRGKPVFLVLWASWCEPCHKELAELTSRLADLQAAGVDVVALSVDGLGEDNSSFTAAASFAKGKQFPFVTGQASEEMTQLLTAFHHQMVCLTRPLPVPVSFLVDGAGRLTTIYKGRVTVDEVLGDIKRPAATTLRERWERAACLPGRMIDHEGFYTSLQMAEMSVFHGIAVRLASEGNRTGRRELLESAADHYQAAVALQPNYAELREGYGITLDQLGRRDDALREYREVLKLDSSRAAVHYYVGNLHAQQQRFGEAITSYKEALRLEPKLKQAQENLERVEAHLKGEKKDPVK